MRSGNIGKILTEVKKGIVIGLLLIGFYGVGAYIYKSQTRNEAESEIKIKDDDKNKGNIEANYEIYGYRYKNEGDKESKVLKRNLGYEKRIAEAVNKEEVHNKLKLEYCASIAEIKKVDKKIMPGTNISFTQAAYTQVKNAYEGYLQKIAQIKQAILTIENKDIERETGCYYEPTRWDKVNNLNYRLKDFLQ
ncbi:hypothetical protein AB8B23_05370 [Leptotrichia sp. HSP-342]|uniref:Lipoprotein n=1 Tax=Leptotrichia mesophila TaxID=3239303 RepID=A0AB39VC98_9FUSO